MTRSWLAFLLFLVSGSPASADGYQDFNLGAAAAEHRDHDTAIKYFSGALGETDLPAHLRATTFLARGQEYVEKGQYDAAVADYDQAIALKSERPELYLSRCAAYADKKLFDKALADCTSAIQLQPHNWQLRQSRHVIYRQLNKFDDIVADYSTFLTERPSDIDLLIGRAQIYQTMGKFDLALADAQAAHAVSRHAALPYDAMGWIYSAQGNFAKALDSVDSGIDNYPDDASQFVAKGFYQWALGRYDDASSSFGRSLDRDNLQSYAFLWLTISEAAQHKDVSEDLIDRFKNADLYEWPGQAVALYVGKSTPEAILKLTGRDPDDDGGIQCEASFFVGEWYRKKGDAAQAKRLIQAAADSCDANSVMRSLIVAELNRLPQ